MADWTNRLASLTEQAQQNLCVEASESARKRIAERLQTIAAELALEWLVGARRFENQSQQTEHWLALLYEELYSDEQPEATRIYARFGLSLPRSQYFARLLLLRRTSQWRHAAQKEIRTALEQVETRALAAQKAKAAHTQRFDLSLSRGGYDQLIVFYDFMIADIVDQGRRPAPPKRLPSSQSLTWFSLTAETALRLLAFLRGKDT